MELSSFSISERAFRKLHISFVRLLVDFSNARARSVALSLERLYSAQIIPIFLCGFLKFNV